MAQALAVPNPYASYAARDAYGNDPKRTKPDYNYLHDHLAARINDLHSLGTPFPNSPNWDQNDKTPAYGPGWEQSLGFLANTAAAGAVGATEGIAIPMAGLLDMSNDLGEWLTYGNPPTSNTTGPTQVAPATAAIAAKKPGDPYADLGLDKSYDIPGNGPMPGFPDLKSPEYQPDFTKADALLKAGAPHPLDTTPEAEM